MNSFSLWLGAGTLLALWRLARSAPQRHVHAWVDLGVLVLASALVGARLFYIGLNWPYYGVHPLEILLLHHGGLGWPGAVLGAALVLGVLALRARAPLGWLSDRFYPLLPPLAITAWLGGWAAGSAYGPLAPQGAWWGLPTLDETGQTLLRLPLQPLAALALLVFFALLDARPPRRPGAVSAAALAGLLLHLLAVSLLRADPAPAWNGLRLDTWAALILLGGLLLALLLGSAASVVRQRSAGSPQPQR